MRISQDLRREREVATKEKKLTNHRAAAADEMIRLAPPRPLSLELALETIAADEQVETTPKSIRLRKAVLDQTVRGRTTKRAKTAAERVGAPPPPPRSWHAGCSQATSSVPGTVCSWQAGACHNPVQRSPHASGTGRRVGERFPDSLLYAEEGNVPDERSRMEVLQALSDKLGSEAAAALMECVPPFAWTDIATKSDLAGLEERLTLRFEARFDRAESRILRWTVGAVFGGITAVGAATAGIAALVG